MAGVAPRAVDREASARHPWTVVMAAAASVGTRMAGGGVEWGTGASGGVRPRGHAVVDAPLAFLIGSRSIIAFSTASYS